MSIREGYEIADIQQAVMALLRYKTTSGGNPWESWTIVEGYPDQNVFETWTAPFLYCHTPLMDSAERQQGGGKAIYTWELVIGGWTDRQKGGSEEAAIMLSSLIRLFDGDAVNAIEFSGTVGGTAFTSQTLPELGITVLGVRNPRQIEFRDEDDFRGEVSIILKA